MARYGEKAAKGDKIAAYIAVKEGLLPYGALKHSNLFPLIQDYSLSCKRRPSALRGIETYSPFALVESVLPVKEGILPYGALKLYIFLHKSFSTSICKRRPSALRGIETQK